MLKRSGVFPSRIDLCIDTLRQLEATKDGQLDFLSKFAFFEWAKERVKVKKPKHVTKSQVARAWLQI